MYIWAILFALLFTFIMCWVAILNQSTLTINLPGNWSVQAYVWEIVLSIAAGTTIFIGLIALFKGSARRRWEKEVETKLSDLGRKLEGLAGKVEELELKIALPPQKVAEEEVASEARSEGEG